jgi:hypothetical protein
MFKICGAVALVAALLIGAFAVAEAPSRGSGKAEDKSTGADRENKSPCGCAPCAFKGGTYSAPCVCIRYPYFTIGPNDILYYSDEYDNCDSPASCVNPGGCYYEGNAGLLSEDCPHCSHYGGGYAQDGSDLKHKLPAPKDSNYKAKDFVADLYHDSSGTTPDYDVCDERLVAFTTPHGQPMRAKVFIVRIKGVDGDVRFATLGCEVDVDSTKTPDFYAGMVSQHLDFRYVYELHEGGVTYVVIASK